MIPFLRQAFLISSASLVLALCLFSRGGWTQDIEREIESDADRYHTCIKLSRTKPSRSFDDAIAWHSLGGGDAAEHCAAVSLIELGHFRIGAERLEALAQQPTDSAFRRSELLSQAAQARLFAGQPEHAHALLVAAIDLMPENAPLYVDRGAVRAEMGLYDQAVADFDHAITLDPFSMDAYLFRASARRYLKEFELALIDLERILDFEPTHLDALLERGIVRRLQGNDAGARRDWMWVLELGPETEAAGFARQNLEHMDVDVSAE